VRNRILVEIERDDRSGPRRVEMPGIEPVAAADLEHPRILFEHEPGKHAALDPQAVVRSAPLPVLVEKMVKPFGPRLDAPLHGKLRKVGPADQQAHEPVDTLQDRHQKPLQENLPSWSTGPGFRAARRALDGRH